MRLIANIIIVAIWLAAIAIAALTLSNESLRWDWKLVPIIPAVLVAINLSVILWHWSRRDA